MSLRDRLWFAWLVLRSGDGGEIGREREEHERALADAPGDWQAWWEERGERELRCILMTAWDPLGVADAPEAWDEYDEYLAGVARHLGVTADADAAEEAIADWLSHVERDHIMGQAGSPDRAADLAHLASTIVAWHEWSFTHGGRRPAEWLPD